MQQHTGSYAAVNGLRLYYEIHGNGHPLVLLHGGGSTIQSTFGRILPELARTQRVIAIELQAHGRTADIDRPFTFENDADDVALLLQELKIIKTDILGFSNGGTTTLQFAIRHPQQVRKIVVASAIYQRNGMINGFWEGMQNASLENMPRQLKEAFLLVNNDPEALQRMFDRDKNRMLGFKDIPEALIRTIEAPALIMAGDKDVVRTEHTIALARLLTHGRLAIVPSGHGDYIGEICGPDNSGLPDFVCAMIREFLQAD